MKRAHDFGRSNGFTLIELAAATALAAILMMGVLTILTGITRDRQILASTHASSANPDLAMTIELVRQDLRCASFLQTDADGTVEIHTMASLDTQTLQPTDRPSLVKYRIADSDGLHLLMREQQLKDDPIEPPSLRTLLALHVRGFEIERLHDTSDKAPAPDAPTANSFQRMELDVPRRVRLKIAFDPPEPSQSSNVNEVLCLR